MEATSFDNFCLAPHGWSDSSLSESDDCDALPIELLEAFLSLKVFRLLAAIASSTHQDEMEATSFDNFCLAPLGWSDSSLPESDD